MDKEKIITYREFLKLFALTPEGYLRFDVLLDEFLRLNPPTKENEEGRRRFKENLEKLMRVADPKDIGLLKNTKTWKLIEKALE